MKYVMRIDYLFFPDECLPKDLVSVSSGSTMEVRALIRVGVNLLDRLKLAEVSLPHAAMVDSSSAMITKIMINDRQLIMQVTRLNIALISMDKARHKQAYPRDDKGYDNSSKLSYLSAVTAD
jgi:hypothetical protein